MVSSIFVFLLLIVFVVVSVAFLTLLGHRLLGYTRIPKSPNRAEFVGILQLLVMLLGHFLGTSICFYYLIIYHIIIILLFWAYFFLC
jgi:hypothetical protein